LLDLALVFLPVLGQTQNMTPSGLQGLPDQGVLRIGDLNRPMLVNNTDKAIAGHLILWVPGLAYTTLAFHPQQRVKMLPPGEQVEVSTGSTVYLRNTPLQAVILQAVIFTDGEVVGPAAQRLVDMVQPRLKAEKDIHQLLVHGNPDTVWSQIEAIANMDLKTGKRIPPGMTFESAKYASTYKSMAHELVLIRDAPLGGLDKAMQRAHTSENYPTLHLRQ
jgi:hypothetical protein